MVDKILWHIDGSGTNQVEEDEWVKDIDYMHEGSRVEQIIERDVLASSKDSTKREEKLVIIRYKSGVEVPAI